MAEADTLEKTKALGICLGASTISLVQVEKNHRAVNGENPVRVVSCQTIPHAGNPKHQLKTALSALNLPEFQKIAATGRRFRHLVNFPSLSEPEAVERAYRFVKPPGIDAPALVSAGGETFMTYVLNRRGRISNVLTGNKCASGTGEFFNQQLRRMNVSFEEAMHWSAVADPYAVSGRCSVFCKSDCTHAINKGIPKSRVTAGLCRMMADKILELLKKIEKKNIMIVGGATRNQMMIEYLKQEIPGLQIPEYAVGFEALGAALWALETESDWHADPAELFASHTSSFDTLQDLNQFHDQVVFNTMANDSPKPGDVCILGLDVGSTTTKAVLLRASDNASLASVYLLTDGDPVGAARKCYQAISDQVRETTDLSEIYITGLGVCGSGRQIAGLHALTDGVINEIIAHAAAAVHFDPDVDTLFEIGGQDAKYTYITAGVPSDYAMNEACSAGTGSFLAEAAQETMNVRVEDIADFALKGTCPPNFNDQCAAFISSDIKTAIHEGIDYHDIIAGLVYSICMNYNNRVKGNRPVGEKIFMQGGVCYNRAVPLAMAALTGKKIIVPPEPGLMGAFGAALEIKKRLDLGVMAEKPFDLDQLAARDVQYGKSFVCGGGKEKCDRRCEINIIIMEGKKYPFGGACNRYYNIRCHLEFDILTLDLVRYRENLIFKNLDSPGPGTAGPPKPTVGINKSFLVNSLFPFYQTFFTNLGMDVVLPAAPSKRGRDLRNSAFCYPAELSHGFFYSLLESSPRPDYLFLPHLRSIPIENNGSSDTQACPFVQGEPFYLKTAFKTFLDDFKQQGTRLLTPFMDMNNGIASAFDGMMESAAEMGVSRKTAESAFHRAISVQQACYGRMKAKGREVLAGLAADPEKTGVVIFGRPYNAMVEEAHMGIPHKFASRGIQVIPFDFLPFENEPPKPGMYWGMGQIILKAARFVEKHPQLFGAYITNFSCGPDSFLISYFRSIMGRKPSLTLELDSHTADAGLETRIEAFLDIVHQYREIQSKPESAATPPFSAFQPAKTFMRNGTPAVATSAGDILPMTDPRVTLLIPSMGQISTRALATVFRHAGYHVAPVAPADESTLKLGRANTSCKECLPLILTTGTMLDYAFHKKKTDEILVYFMPSASGPCRFGQYAIFMQDLIQRLALKDVAVFSLTSDNTYSTMGKGFDNKKAWSAIVCADVMEDIHSLLLANAEDRQQAETIFEIAFSALLKVIPKGNFNDLCRELAYQVSTLAAIPKKMPWNEVPRILLTGEIFVRRDDFSRQKLNEKMSEMGFAVICSPVAEWFRYADFIVEINGNWSGLSPGQKLRFLLRQTFMNRYENRLAAAFSNSGIIHARPVNVPKIVRTAAPFISEKLSGEAVLTVGSAIYEIATEVCGVIALGPFGCMPNRLSEAILTEAMNRDVKLRSNGSHTNLSKILEPFDDLPFLAIETDGSPFPQLITAKLEAFAQQARRLHEQMQAVH